MADIFLKKDVINLLKNKFVLMMGDSNMRCIYKDIIWLMTTGNITPVKSFHAAVAKSPFCGDKIIDRSEITNGRDYYEIREYKNSACENLLLRYHFITQAYGKSVQIAMDNIEKGTTPAPKIVILNSCLWDLNRWGPSQEDSYKSNIVKLFKRLRSLLPEDALVLWVTTPPVSREQIKGGLFIQQLQFMKHSQRFMIMEANHFVQQMCVAFEYDVLDLHYHMRHQLNSRANDGVHWEPHAMRHIVNLLLTHLALSFEIPLPNLITNRYISAAKQRADEAVQGVKVDIHLEKLVLDEVFGKNVVNVIPRKLESSVALIDSTDDNIVTASADMTHTTATADTTHTTATSYTSSSPTQSTLNGQPENISPKSPVTENYQIKSVMKTLNSLKDVETAQNITMTSNLSSDSLNENNLKAKSTISTTDTATSPVKHNNNDLKIQSSLSVGQTSSLVSISFSVANKAVSSSAVSSTLEELQTITKEGLPTNKPEKRVIKTAKRRIKTTKKQDKVLAQQAVEENLQECILNILNSPDSTTSQILLESIDNIGNQTSPVSRRGGMWGTPRGLISMGAGSRGNMRGSRTRGEAVRGGAIRGMQMRGRGLRRVGTLDMFENEFENSNMNYQPYDFMEWGDMDWREGMELDDYNTGYDLGYVDYTSDVICSSVTDSQGFDNPSTRNSVFDRLGPGTKLPPQSGFNIDFRSRQEMPHDNYHIDPQNTYPRRQWGPNHQNNIPPNNFHHELHHADFNYQRETKSHNSNFNHQYLQQFSNYLQNNHQRFPSYSMGPRQMGPPQQMGPLQQMGPPHQMGPPWQRDGRQQWDGPGFNFGCMGPNESAPFWNNYPTNNFPWNNQY